MSDSMEPRPLTAEEEVRLRDRLGPCAEFRSAVACAESTRNVGEWCRPCVVRALLATLDEARQLVSDLTPLARIGLEALRAMRSYHDLDGGDVEGWATDVGAIAPHRMKGPCGDDCACAEFQGRGGGSFACYRDTDATQRARAYLKGGAG